MPVIARVSDVRFRHLVRPGDVLDLHVELKEQTSRALFLKGQVKVAGKIAAQLDFVAMESDIHIEQP